MGTTYRFRVDGVEADTGTINLHLNDVQPPPNDNFANAIVAVGHERNENGRHELGATLETGEPLTVAGSPAGASIWYSWTAPDSRAR